MNNCKKGFCALSAHFIKKGGNIVKKFVSLLLAAVLVLALFPVQPASAAQDYEVLEVIRYEDGSYLEISIETAPTQTRASGSTSKTKNYVYYSSNGTAKWKMSLNGAFSYTGTSAVCSFATCSVTIYDSTWYTVSRSSSKSGATAYGSATVGQKVNGVVVSTVSHNLSLTCDKNGNVS